MARLETFRSKIKERSVDFWSNRDALRASVLAALPKQFNIRPRPGWIRATDALSNDIADELSRVSKENADLRTKLGALSEIPAEVTENRHLIDLLKSSGLKFTLTKRVREITGPTASNLRGGVAKSRKKVGTVELSKLRLFRHAAECLCAPEFVADAVEDAVLLFAGDSGADSALTPAGTNYAFNDWKILGLVEETFHDGQSLSPKGRGLLSALAIRPEILDDEADLVVEIYDQGDGTSADRENS